MVRVKPTFAYTGIVRSDVTLSPEEPEMARAVADDLAYLKDAWMPQLDHAELSAYKSDAAQSAGGWRLWQGLAAPRVAGPTAEERRGVRGSISRSAGIFLLIRRRRCTS
jgi:hypothetical protein